MDNEYRKEWDKTLVEHVQLQIDESSGTEIGHTIKKFPLLTPREYVLAWRVWEGKDRTFYCFIKVRSTLCLDIAINKSKSPNYLRASILLFG